MGRTALVGRSALRLVAAALFLAGGLGVAVLAAGPAFGGDSATSTVGTVSTTTAVTTNPAQAVLVLDGHGWGHGLGLGQWGAYGYAKHGWSYDRILAHYYTGTSLGQAKAATVRVLLLSAKQAAVSSTVPWTVTDAAGRQAKLAPGTFVLEGALALPAHPALRPPYTFTSSGHPSVDGKPYRGKLVVSSDGKVVQVIDVVGLEQYLKGVVPSEVPSYWPPAALAAQAVAARSYALANLAKGRAYDLYGDTRSQVYGGIDAETAPTSAAVAATTGDVVLYDGTVADTLFFSTSGGRTASALEATGTAVPYLVSVADPYDTLSPYHDWGPLLLDAAKAAKELKVPAPIDDVETLDGASGRVRSVTVVSGDDSEATLTGEQVRAALGLRSTWFSPALLELLPAAKTMTYGGAVSLTGTVRGVDVVSLESRTSARPVWTPAGSLTIRPGGAFSTLVRPAATTQYRLAWGAVRAGLAKIAVAPRVDASVAAGSVSGSIRPVVAGAAVQLQQQSGTTWTTVSSTFTDAAGGWSFSGTLPAGTYRIRCAPGQGLAPGLSATLVAQ